MLDTSDYFSTPPSLPLQRDLYQSLLIATSAVATVEAGVMVRQRKVLDKRTWDEMGCMHIGSS